MGSPIPEYVVRSTLLMRVCMCANELLQLRCCAGDSVVGRRSSHLISHGPAREISPAYSAVKERELVNVHCKVGAQFFERPMTDTIESIPGERRPARC